MEIFINVQRVISPKRIVKVLSMIMVILYLMKGIPEGWRLSMEIRHVVNAVFFQYAMVDALKIN